MSVDPYGTWVLCDLDVCQCGDYRHQHPSDGRCAFSRARGPNACVCDAYHFHHVERRSYPLRDLPGVRPVDKGAPSRP